MKAFGFVLRMYSYLFHFLLSLFLLGLWIVSASSSAKLTLGMLPFKEENVLTAVLVLGLVGLISVILAVTGIFRYLLPLWAAVVVYLMLKGFFLSSYGFGSADAFKTAACLFVGALLAFIGGLFVLGKSRPRRV